MKVLIISLCVFIVRCQEFKLSGLFFGCSKDVTSDYHYSLQDFSTRFLKEVAKFNNHFVISQYSIWLALAAIAEGSNGDIQNKLLKALNLPMDWCFREKYYEIATGLESPGLPEDVHLVRKRLLVLNDDVKLNNTWRDIVGAAGLVNIKIVNLKNASTITYLRNLITAKLDNINVDGNSLILDSLDYKGLWSTEFENTSIEHGADFFNDEGVKIGTIDLLKIKKRVKLAHLPILNAKVLELPVGNNGRYRMLFIMNNRKKSIRQMIEHFPCSLIVDSFPFLLESVVPLEVAIPRFVMTSELDLKKVIDNVGMGNIWNNSEASKHISDPPPSPTTLIERVTVEVDGPGLNPPTDPSLPGITHVVTGLASAVGHGFIANRPFVFGLVDSQTRSWLFTGVYSQPSSNSLL